MRVKATKKLIKILGDMVRLQRLEMSPSVSHSAAFMREKITDGSFNVDMQIDRTHTYKHCSSW